MFIDARQIEESSILKTTVCIIGGGIAGITLALELKKIGIDLCLLESGGLKPDKTTNNLYRGENHGLPYDFDEDFRSRYFGGSSNCWGGWCAPMEPIDFEKRDWVNNSGWPFGLDEIEPYYRRAHEVLKLGPYNYDPEFWENVITRAHVKRIPFITRKVRDVISQFSPPARFNKLYGGDLEESKDVRVLLYANVVNIETDEFAQIVSQVKVTTFQKNTFRVSAKIFVLASGGIENARLLLASNENQGNGIGNDKDLVGRYFMDHPRLLLGTIQLRKQWRRNMLYDIRYNYHNIAVSGNGVCIASQFSPTPEVQRSEGLLNSRTSFSSVFAGENSEGAFALWKIKQGLIKRDFNDLKLRRDLISMMSNPLDVAGYALTRFYKPRLLINEVKFQIIVEPQPNFLSRVKLLNERDELGVQRIGVNWILGDLEKKTIDMTLVILAKEFQENGVTESIKLDESLIENEWPRKLEGTWHHMGTTRMSDSPNSGVVDRNSRVHGIANLFIAGSSIFPTAGANFPTITLVALTIRLADHIRRNGLLDPQIEI